MAYSDSIRDDVPLLRRTITHTADFSGRSRRTEVIYYWIASALLGVVINFVVATVLTFEAELIFSNGIELVLLVPMFALFVRRLHDQGRCGWWSLLLPLAVLLNVPQTIAELRGDIQAMVAQSFTPFGVMAELVGFAIFILCLLPGTDGTNRFGTDPRLDEG